MNFPQIGFIGFSFIFLSSFLIDVDHYMLYVYKKHNLSLRNAYKWFVEHMKRRLALPKPNRSDYKYEILIFHGIEFWIILFLLTYTHFYFWYVFIGVMFHMLLDGIALVYWGFPLYTKLSITYLWLRDRNKPSF